MALTTWRLSKFITYFQGVVICVTSLVMALAQDHLDEYAVCYMKAVDRLQRVCSHEMSYPMRLSQFYSL